MLDAIICATSEGSDVMAMQNPCQHAKSANIDYKSKL